MAEVVCVSTRAFLNLLHLGVEWNDKGGQAIKFEWRGETRLHDYRIYKPAAIRLWPLDVAYALVKIDHLISDWPDSHLDVALVYVASTGEIISSTVGDENVAYRVSRQVGSVPPHEDPWRGPKPEEPNVNPGDFIEWLIEKLVAAFAGHAEGKRQLPVLGRRALSALIDSRQRRVPLLPLVLSY